MVNYQRSKIYKIVADETDRVYIGATAKATLAERMSGHRAVYKRYRTGNSNAYVSSFEVLMYPSARIVLVEAYPCRSKDELSAREFAIIKATANCVNVQRRDVDDAVVAPIPQAAPGQRGRPRKNNACPKLARAAAYQRKYYAAKRAKHAAANPLGPEDIAIANAYADELIAAL